MKKAFFGRSYAQHGASGCESVNRDVLRYTDLARSPNEFPLGYNIKQLFKLISNRITESFKRTNVFSKITNNRNFRLSHLALMKLLPDSKSRLSRLTTNRMYQSKDNATLD
ncbi:hypothetical protein BaRGS_00005399 [Batillaria attramentaria]|uniref:Uncharacterized protein n=1 Tax=Batillaria attramentaria TaxID=370345 RepID=A0ABD0LWJ5_9CAEN